MATLSGMRSESGEIESELHDALAAARLEGERQRNRIAQLEVELASAGQELEDARRDVHFLRMRVGMLQAYSDDLLTEAAQRSTDTIKLAAEYDQILAYRDRVVRELVGSYEERLAVMVERFGNAVLSANAESTYRKREAAARDELIESMLRSESWRVTRPLRAAIARLRSFRVPRRARVNATPDARTPEPARLK